jgi:hypothetical protein
LAVVVRFTIGRSRPVQYVYACHSVRPDEGAGAVEVIFSSEQEARRYARSRSNDWSILSCSVTRYELAQLGTRHPLAFYMDGDEQAARSPRPGQYYPTDGPVPEQAS